MVKKENRKYIILAILLITVLIGGMVWFLMPKGEIVTEEVVEGEYNGTYTFRDEIGKESTDISFIDIDTSSEENIEVKVVGEERNHKSVLKLKDENGAGTFKVSNNIDREDGTIEFWFLTDNIVQSATVMGLRQNTKSSVIIWIDGKSLFLYDGNNIVEAFIVLKNKWIHFRVDFDCEKDVWTLTINDDEIQEDINFFKPIDKVNRWEIIGSWDYGHNWYYDAIGLSWDENYNIGDNMQEIVE